MIPQRAHEYIHGQNGNGPENMKRPENICCLNEGTDSQRIDVVFDVYRDNSIRTPRQRREAQKMVMNSET